MEGQALLDEDSRPRLDRTLGTVLQLDIETILYIVIIVLALIARFYDLESRVMSHDETTHAYFAWQLEQGMGYSHDPLSHGPLQFHLVALSYFLFGDTDATARFPAAFFGVAAIGLVILFRRWFGKSGVLIAMLLMLVSPYMLYYSRYVRNESLVVPLAMLTIWAMLRYHETRRSLWLYLFTISLSLHFSTKETAFILTAQIGLFLVAYQIWQWMTERWERSNLKLQFIAGLTGLAIGAALGAIGYSQASVVGEEMAETTEAVVQGATLSPVMIIGVILALLGLGVMLAALLRNYGAVLREDFPIFDLILVIGTMMLPLIAPFPAKILGWDPLAYDDPVSFARTLTTAIVLILLSMAIGLLWDRRRWAIVAGLFYVPFIILHTTLFTNGRGIATGLVGSLGYWLNQQGVERGSQPHFFYALIQIPIYEYLPAIGVLIALAFMLKRGRNVIGKRSDSSSDKGTSAWTENDRPIFVPLFLFYWVVSSLLAYSYAGERMPWLTVHIALPMILLSGWGIGRFLDTILWQKVIKERGWLLFILMIALVFALQRTVGLLLGPNPPLQGNELSQLSSTMAFISALLVAAAMAAAIITVSKGWTLRQLLSLAGVLGILSLFVLTARAAFRAAYINYDLATEYLVYAHGGQGPKQALEQIEDLSIRLTGGLHLDIAYDNEMLYPYWWYLRNYTNAHYFGENPGRDILERPVVVAGAANWAKVEPIMGDRFEAYKYIRLWWPNQDYFKLRRSSLESEWRASLPAEEQADAGEIPFAEYVKRFWEHIKPFFIDPVNRKAIWEIWFNRDFSDYGLATGRDLSLSNWDPRSEMKLYIRKDIAAKVWDYGVSSVAREAEEYVDPYADRYTILLADQVIGEVGSGAGQFSSPRGVAIAPDGSIYIADTMNHRIQRFNPDGQLVSVWGSLSEQVEGEAAPTGTFREPWGIAVAPDGSVYVADTWNHRVQHFTAEGEFLDTFGVYGQAEDSFAFWGPRGVVVDQNGRVFVADTGNKRVVIFDPIGQPLGEFGGFGLLPGYLDEPVGLGVDGQGRIYVADTWNQRIQIFEEVFDNIYESVLEVPVDAWFGQSVENKPYLAASENGAVCVTDPEAYRVLCFSREGEFLVGWGSFGTSESEFGLLGGIAFDSSCGAWVVDSGNSRLMRFSLDICH